jgi:hypothetical protein
MLADVESRSPNWLQSQKKRNGVTLENQGPHKKRPKAKKIGPKKQLPMWHQYRVELYPHFGQLSWIRDSFGNEFEFPSAFRLSRCDGRPKGIVKIIK